VLREDTDVDLIDIIKDERLKPRPEWFPEKGAYESALANWQKQQAASTPSPQPQKKPPAAKPPSGPSGGAATKTKGGFNLNEQLIRGASQNPPSTAPTPTKKTLRQAAKRALASNAGQKAKKLAKNKNVQRGAAIAAAGLLGAAAIKGVPGARKGAAAAATGAAGATAAKKLAPRLKAKWNNLGAAQKRAIKVGATAAAVGGAAVAGHRAYRTLQPVFAGIGGGRGGRGGGEGGKGGGGGGVGGSDGHIPAGSSSSGTGSSAPYLNHVPSLSRTERLKEVGQKALEYSGGGKGLALAAGTGGVGYGIGRGNRERVKERA
jgi:hypothetical protein